MLQYKAGVELVDPILEARLSRLDRTVRPQRDDLASLRSMQDNRLISHPLRDRRVTDIARRGCHLPLVMPAFTTVEKVYKIYSNLINNRQTSDRIGYRPDSLPVCQQDHYAAA